MDLVQIRYFLVLSQTLNFTRAAEQCNVTQPALTKSIQRLEDELGGPLILRERSLTQLTELGRAMLPLLARTAEAADAVRAHASKVRRGQAAAPLRVGVGSAIPLDGLFPLLREVAQRIDGLELELRHAPGPALAEEVLAGDLDAALLPEVTPLPERLNRWPLYQERIVLAAPDAHPFSEMAEVPASALDGNVVLDRADPHGSGPAAALDRLRDHLGIRPQIRHRGTSEEQVCLMVRAGLGVALVSDRQGLPPGVVVRALVAPTLEHPVVLAVAGGRPMNRAVSAFTKLVRTVSWTA